MILGLKAEIGKVSHPPDLSVLLLGASNGGVPMGHIRNRGERLTEDLEDLGELFLVSRDRLLQPFCLGHQTFPPARVLFPGDDIG